MLHIAFVFFVMVHTNSLYAATQILEAASAEVRLLGDLFDGYNKVARPVRNASHTVKVKVGFTLAQIDDLNAKHQKLTTSGWFTVMWTDENLTWDPVEYDGLDLVVVTPNMVWLPSAAVSNSARQVYDEAHYRMFRVVVTSDGTMTWEPGGEFLTQCNIDILYYPFDDQTCKLVVENWVYDTSKVNLVHGDLTTIDLNTYQENGEWDITSTEVKRVDNSYKCCPKEQFAEMQFVIHVRRRTLYYVMNIILPAMFISSLVLLNFFLPPDSGEKIALGVTLLLSFSVFVVMIAEKVPSTSKAVPIISMYLTYLMAISALSVCSSVTVLYLHHKTPTRPPSDTLRRFLRIQRSDNISPQTPDTFTNLRQTIKEKRMSSVEIISNNQTTHSPKDSESYNQICEYLKELTECAKYLTRKEKEATQEQKHVEEWGRVATKLDRVFFWIFAFLLIVGSLILLIVLPHLKPSP